MDQSRPIVFISYSWDSENHKEWVLKLANDLVSQYGVDVILDQYELSAGRDLVHFMESSIEKASKVVVILTPNYKIKAEERKGGVGAEYSMISQGIFNVQSSDKFVPVLREGDQSKSCPGYLKSRVYHSMLDNSTYNSDLFELTRLIYNKPKVVKPELGPIPKFDAPGLITDPIIESANDLLSRENINLELDRIVKSNNGLKLAIAEIKSLFKIVEEKAERYTNETSFRFKIQKREYDLSLILSCSGYSVCFRWEQYLGNSAEGSKLSVSFWEGEQVFDHRNHGYLLKREPVMTRITTLRFDLNLQKEPVWVDDSRQVHSYKSVELAQRAFSDILEKVRDEKEKGFRR